MSDLYKILVILHILTVVFGIGSVVLNGVYGNLASKQPGPGGLAISQANFDVSMIAEKIIYLIPVFGILAVLASDDVWDFSQTWIWLSLVLYFVAMGIVHSVLIPSHRKINELSAKLVAGQGGPADGAAIQALGKKMAPAGAATDLIVVVLIVLMVWKPGV